MLCLYKESLHGDNIKHAYLSKDSYWETEYKLKVCVSNHGETHQIKKQLCWIKWSSIRIRWTWKRNEIGPEYLYKGIFCTEQTEENKEEKDLHLGWISKNRGKSLLFVPEPDFFELAPDVLSPLKVCSRTGGKWSLWAGGGTSTEKKNQLRSQVPFLDFTFFTLNNWSQVSCWESGIWPTPFLYIHHQKWDAFTFRI